MNYNKISKDTFNYLYKSRTSLNDSPLNPQIRALVEVRVSQINQCSYCLHLHAAEALKLGIRQEKVDALQDGEISTLFDDKEKSTRSRGCN